MAVNGDRPDHAADEADEGDTDDTQTPASSGKSGWMGRLLSPSPARTPPPDTPRGRRQAMERLNERERRYSFVAAAAAAAFAVIIYLSETDNHHFKLAKGQLTPQTTLYLGLGAAALLTAATYFGRRAPVAFVCLFSFFIFSNGAGSLIAGLPFIGLGGWLLYRSFQTQRRAAAGDRDKTSSRTSPRAKSTPERATSTSAAPARKAPPARAKSTGRPTANKRYTPKRPPPKAPKPSWRERRAAEAKE
jgi:hypothetical protein